MLQVAELLFLIVERGALLAFLNASDICDLIRAVRRIGNGNNHLCHVAAT